MSDTSAITVPRPNRGRSPVRHPLHLAPLPRPETTPTLAFDGVEGVEIIAPDRYCVMLLLGYAAKNFQARLVPGPEWIVRFRAPAEGGDWVVDLLTLVERWLVSAPIPCANCAGATTAT